MNARYSKFVSFAAAVLAAAALSGCGGGGGGGGTSPEFRAQWGLGATNVRQAHATLAAVRGAGVKPGAGVTVAVIDSGVDLDHPELDGADIAETRLQSLPDEDGTVISHGTAVASVIAAQPNGSGFLGIAYGADVNVYTVPIGQNSGVEPFDWEQAYRDVLTDGADIVNASYGSSGTFIETYTEAQIRALPWFGEFTVIAQKTPVVVPNPTIFVWAAGNDHGEPCDPTQMGVQKCDADPLSPLGGYHNATSPSVEGGAVARLTELQGHNIVVVAIDEDGGISDFSNRCGIAAQWCIAAPGNGVAIAYFGPRSDTDPTPTRAVGQGGGTSYAAPMVAGGLALMKHYFNDTMSNAELVTRLFTTANKTGVYGTDEATYGQGLMNLGAAVRPVGETMVTMGRHIGDAGHSVRTTNLRLGGALGDGLSRSLAGREIAAFDRLGAPFWFDLSGLVGTATRSSSTARLRDLLARAEEEARPAAGGTRLSVQQYAGPFGQDGWRFGLYESPVQAESSLLNLAQNAATMTFRTKNGFEATAFTNTGLAHQDTPESGAVLSWRPSDSPYGVRLGWLGEQETMLGSTADGAFGGLSAGSVVAGFEMDTEFEGWRLAADAELGLVAADTNGGIIAGLSEVTTSAISFRADRRLTNGDEITLSLSQPPRIEHGVARLTVPVSRTKDGMVLHETISADLSPSGRQIDLAARWRRNHVLGGDLLAEAVFSHNPGHVDGKPEFGLLAGWRVAF